MSTMLKAGVMGWPVSHSRSPRLHGHWLKRYAIEGSYEAVPVRPEDLPTALRRIVEEGWRGVNLTVPHKEAAMDLVASVDDTARRIGAVNTLVVGEDGAIAATNTDAFGFVENLRDHVGEAVGTAFSGRPVTILGAGGAARAVCVGLADAGVTSLRIVNRTRARADVIAALVEDMGVSASVLGWDETARSLADAGLLVNTTTRGMTGEPDLEIDLGPLPPDAVVNDIVYAPLETSLLARARARGNPAVDGLGMLLHQARAGFRAWFGIDPAVDGDLRAAVLAD